jgi:hypothetical protein
MRRGAPVEEIAGCERSAVVSRIRLPCRTRPATAGRELRPSSAWTMAHNRAATFAFRRRSGMDPFRRWWRIAAGIIKLYSPPRLAFASGLASLRQRLRSPVSGPSARRRWRLRKIGQQSVLPCLEGRGRLGALCPVSFGSGKCPPRRYIGSPAHPGLT